MKIGVTGKTSYTVAVKVEWVEKTNEKEYEGFLYDLFKQVLKVSEKSYTLHYEFEANGSYNYLVENIIKEEFFSTEIFLSGVYVHTLPEKVL